MSWAQSPIAYLLMKANSTPAIIRFQRRFRCVSNLLHRVTDVMNAVTLFRGDAARLTSIRQLKRQPAYCHIATRAATTIGSWKSVASAGVADEDFSDVAEASSTSSNSTRQREFARTVRPSSPVPMSLQGAVREFEAIADPAKCGHLQTDFVPRAEAVDRVREVAGRPRRSAGNGTQRDTVSRPF
jgi:hypothetical protein